MGVYTFDGRTCLTIYTSLAQRIYQTVYTFARRIVSRPPQSCVARIAAVGADSCRHDDADKQPTVICQGGFRRLRVSDDGLAWKRHLQVGHSFINSGASNHSLHVNPIVGRSGGVRQANPRQFDRLGRCSQSNRSTRDGFNTVSVPGMGRD